MKSIKQKLSLASCTLIAGGSQTAMAINNAWDIDHCSVAAAAMRIMTRAAKLCEISIVLESVPNIGVCLDQCCGRTVVTVHTIETTYKAEITRSIEVAGGSCIVTVCTACGCGRIVCDKIVTRGEIVTRREGFILVGGCGAADHRKGGTGVAGFTIN